MGLMVMRRRDPEWSSYGSEEKGKKYCHQIHVDDAAGRAKEEKSAYLHLCKSKFTPLQWGVAFKIEELGEK